jgi:hypothetical protein
MVRRSADSLPPPPRRAASEHSNENTPRRGPPPTALHPSFAAGGHGSPSMSWLEASPMRFAAAEMTVQLQVRGVDGAMLPVVRRFAPGDTLLTVMHEALRLVTEAETRKQRRRAVPWRPPADAVLSFAVPFPARRVYPWAALATTTVADAKLVPRGSLVLQLTRPPPPPDAPADAAEERRPESAE